MIKVACTAQTRYFKNPQFDRELPYLDDSSRCVVAAVVLKETTSENSVAVLKKAIKEFGTPATILSDNGSCFVGVMRKTPAKSII